MLRAWAMVVLRHRRWILSLGAAMAIGCGAPDVARAQVGASLEPDRYAKDPRVLHYLRYFEGTGRDRMARWLERGAPYMSMIRDRLSAANLPEDLRFLPLIESGFANVAISRAGAVGMWQLMPETAREYGLHVDDTVDERRDPYRATDAATRHLRDLFDRFGSPFLAEAAYNAGAGSVAHGLSHLPEAPLGDSTFFRLRDASALAPETSDYIPQLLAATLIARNPERYGFERPPEGAAPPKCDSVVVTKPILLRTAARLAGVSERLVRELNPKYVRGITPDRVSSTILMPAGSVGVDFARALGALPSEAAAATDLGGNARASRRAASLLPDHLRHVTVKRGEKPSDIARRCGVSEEDLRHLNLISRGMALRAGQILILPDEVR